MALQFHGKFISKYLWSHTMKPVQIGLEVMKSDAKDYNGMVFIVATLNIV